MSQNQAAEEIIALTVQDDETADTTADGSDSLAQTVTESSTQGKKDCSDPAQGKAKQTSKPLDVEFSASLAIETSEIEIQPDYSELLESCQKWFDELQHQKIVDAIEAIDESKRTAQLQCELGRAYNNLAAPGDKTAFQKALQCLKPLEEELKNDFCWNYRIGYTYYHLEQEWNALHFFQRALLLRNQDQDTIQFIHKCFSALGAPEFVYNFASRVDRMWEEFIHKESEWRDALNTKLDFSSVLKQIQEVVEKALLNPHLAMSCDVDHSQEVAKYVLTFELNNTTTLIYALRYLVAHAPKLLTRHWRFTVGHEKNDLWSMGNEVAVDPNHILIKMLDAKTMEKVHAEQDAASKMLSLYGDLDQRDDHIETTSLANEAKLQALNEEQSYEKSEQKEQTSAHQESSTEQGAKLPLGKEDAQDQILPLSKADLIALQIIQNTPEQEEDGVSSNKIKPSDTSLEQMECDAQASAKQTTSKKIARVQEAEVNSEDKLSEKESLDEGSKEDEAKDKESRADVATADGATAQEFDFMEALDSTEPYIPQLITPQNREKYSLSLYSEELSRLLRENHRRSTPESREQIQNLVRNIMNITHTKLGECTAFTAFASFRFTGEKRLFDDIQAPAFNLAEIDSKVAALDFKLNLTDSELVEQYMRQEYELKPNTNPNEPKLRQEIFSGWTQLPQLNNEYIMDDTALINLYHQHGITLGFISYEFAEWSYPDNKLTKQRTELQEKLIKFINLHPMCLVIGGAYGLYHDYVDFICFGDVRALQRELYTWCHMHKDTQMMVYAPFRFAPVTIIYDAVAEANKAEMRQDIELMRRSILQDEKNNQQELLEAEPEQANKQELAAQELVASEQDTLGAKEQEEHTQAEQELAEQEQTEQEPKEAADKLSTPNSTDVEKVMHLAVPGTSSLAKTSTAQENTQFVSTFHPRLVKAISKSSHEHTALEGNVQAPSAAEHKLKAQRAIEKILAKIKSRHEVEFHPSEALKRALNLLTPEDQAQQEQMAKERAAAIQAQIDAGLPILLDNQCADGEEAVDSADKLETVVAPTSSESCESESTDDSELPSMVVEE